jgi:hypothetical protein
MRASLPLRGIGTYVPDKDSDMRGLGVLSVAIGGTTWVLVMAIDYQGRGRALASLTVSHIMDMGEERFKFCRIAETSESQSIVG